MRRKPANQRLESITRLRRLLRTSRGRVDRGLRRLGAAASYGGLSCRRIFEQVDSELAGARRQLAAAEDAYVRDRFRPTLLRRQRDQLGADLLARHDSIRQLLASTLSHRYGAAIVEPAPESVRPLIRHVRLTASLLRLLDLEPPRLAGVSLDARALADELEPRADALAVLCDALEEACAAAGVASERADEALAEADRAVRWAVRGLEGLCALARLGDLAARIRAAARRRS